MLLVNYLSNVTNNFYVEVKEKYRHSYSYKSFILCTVSHLFRIAQYVSLNYCYQYKKLYRT